MATRWLLLHLRGWTYLSGSMERRPGTRLILLVTRRHHGAVRCSFDIVGHCRAAAMGADNGEANKDV